MHLKTLTLKGFKSFASATSLRLEPGITCVVGPNGSGKSNVVDALAWVMGEQGAKTLRGGKMEDVIFAGTSGRPPLGRAEVSLTIDNADGALPIDYAEVTITRTMFRSGGSEYAINGSPARLLDVQDLLSDSGIGREMHVIVGQNQLDTILRATPEERRGFVEEAAGVLKHRKRKEKALRKLDAMQANLTRLTDLTGEIRRQLTPLAKQADVARRAQVVQAEARDSRARLLADELVQLTATLEAEVADETALRARRTEVEQAIDSTRSRLADLERRADEAAPRLKAAADTYYGLQALRERLRGTAGLAEERARLLGTESDDAGVGGNDPVELETQAERVRGEERSLAVEVDAARSTLERRVEERGEAERALAEEDRRVASLLRAAADRREGLARLTGQVAARRSRVEAAEGEVGRLREALAEAERRGARAQSDFSALENQVAGVEEGEEGLDAEHEAAVQAVESAEAELDRQRDAERAAERDRATWTARKEALELGLDRKDGPAALLAATEQVSGLLGSVASLLTVRAGYEEAVAAALGEAADGVAVESVETAVDALRLLKDQDAGRSGLLVAHAGSSPGGSWAASGRLPDGAVPAADLVDADGPLGAAVAGLLAAHVVVPGLAEARRVVDARPDLVAVTLEGDVLGARTARGGSGAAPSVLQVQAALDEATERLEDAVRRAEQARFAVQAATVSKEEAAERAEATLERLHESDARLAGVAEQLGDLGSALRAARAEAERLNRSLGAATRELEAGRAELDELTERLRAAEEAPDEAEPDTSERDRLAEAAVAARGHETEARLALRTGEERLRALAGRAESLERAARREREARERAAHRAEQRRRQAEVARAVATGGQLALRVLEHSLASAADARAAAEEERAGRSRELGEARAALDALAAELRELTDSVHRDEVARAQQRLRIEQLQQRAADELGIDPEVLVEEMGPHRPVPPPPLAPGDAEPEPGEREPVPFVRAEQEKRLRRAERALAQLGRVNPLALEEFAALEERHAFLTTQLEDLKKSRKDLLDIVKEVDERVEQVFTEAFADTARHFEDVFARLFPGGEGRLVLTDPGDMLTTGIEVEARPAGKKVKRLSLLSGGERSLTAVALLVAIFKARPSPFYVLDEVEAALDDTNLGRLLTLLEELRNSSQLVVITHQKRTMEVADALYGVSMRGDGVTTVVSQRLRELVDA